MRREDAQDRRDVPALPLSVAGRSSPSFIIALGLLVLAAVGYAAWWIWWPTDLARSERIVRQFARDSGAELQSYGRELRREAREALKAGRSAEFAAGLEKRAAEATERAVLLADQAIDRIDDLERIAPNTRRNRMRRIRKRLDEVKAAIAEATEEVRASPAGSPPGRP